ncbi:MAG: flagellar basal body rod protein FlgB [Planctomycetaceae bacterium]
MLQPILNSTTIPILERVAAFNERRQEVLAGNIANIDTPGYRTRDLPVARFQESLEKMIAQRRTGFTPSANTGSTIPMNSGLSQGQSLQRLVSLSGSSSAVDPQRELFQTVEVSPSQDLTFQDGNNRSLEREMMQLTKNVMMQTFAIEVMASQMNMIETAIVGRA